jgi:hypothetical protein
MKIFTRDDTEHGKEYYLAEDFDAAQPAQEPVAWPCLIDTADFSKGTVTVVMQCEDYKVSAGTHWVSTTPPQPKPFQPDWANFEEGRKVGRTEAFEQIADKIKAMPWETDTKDSFIVWLKEQA